MTQLIRINATFSPSKAGEILSIIVDAAEDFSISTEIAKATGLPGKSQGRTKPPTKRGPEGQSSDSIVSELFAGQVKGKVLSAAEIGAELVKFGFAKTSGSSVAQRLVERGELERVGFGLYTRKEPAPDGQ